MKFLNKYFFNFLSNTFVLNQFKNRGIAIGISAIFIAIYLPGSQGFDIKQGPNNRVILDAGDNLYAKWPSSMYSAVSSMSPKNI